MRATRHADTAKPVSVFTVEVNEVMFYIYEPQRAHIRMWLINAKHHFSSLRSTKPPKSVVTVELFISHARE
jgi:hypothetical protein